MEFVDFTQIERELSECRKDWKLHNQFGMNPDKKSHHDVSNTLSGRRPNKNNVLSRYQGY